MSKAGDRVRLHECPVCHTPDVRAMITRIEDPPTPGQGEYIVETEKHDAIPGVWHKVGGIRCTEAELNPATDDGGEW
ncbi:hypothetical protein BOH72_01795 [Mycobacterium sp. WY10]|nr:hypothetical protein BOH72_01795 [Mycobacterium sp. WY10]